MLKSNQPIFKQLMADRRIQEFALELNDVFGGDPTYSGRKLKVMLESAARGERIIKFEDRYVISSAIPPVPSRAFKTFVSAGRDKQNLFADLTHARRSAPATVNLCITPRCPYQCEHCGAILPEGRSELTAAQWIRIVRSLQDLSISYILFSGGEPLVRDDMEEILRSVDDRSITLLFTNGLGLTPERARSLKQAGLFILAVSLDSPEPEEHNRVRRNPDAFSHAINAMRNASQAGLYTLVSSVVYRKDLNKENLFKLFRLAKQNGAHEVRIHQPVPAGKLCNPQHADQIVYTKTDISKLYRIQFAANQSANGYPKVSSLPYTEGPCKFGCGAGVSHSYISSTGDLWPCDFVPLSFGNVLEDDIRALYDRMIQAAGVPRNDCMAKQLVGRLDGRQLPLAPEESAELCRSCQSRSYPRFLRDLQ